MKRCLTLLCLAVLCQSACAATFKDLQAALSQYDPIIHGETKLVGTLHFPEFERVLPRFYRQLFEKVNIKFTASRQSCQIELIGKSEPLKDFVRQYFFEIENDFKKAYQEVLDNDPLFRLKKVAEHKEDFHSKIVVKPTSTEFQFKDRKQAKPDKRLDRPSFVAFEMDMKGKLRSLTVHDDETETQINFISHTIADRHYFSELQMVQFRHKVPHYRNISIKYKEVGKVLLPEVITMTEVDSRGLAKTIPGNLNPISMLFKHITAGESKGEADK
ncbi:MAG: hypothetical protein HQL32_00195 [Planctomycetes bacterium]|nr:hypothetical protein [Planctomycetota bacterium]